MLFVLEMENNNIEEIDQLLKHPFIIPVNITIIYLNYLKRYPSFEKMNWDVAVVVKVTEIIFQDNELLSRHREYRYMPDKMTWDPNCYECKVRYRDPKANDLVMYLHAWRYKVKKSPEILFNLS